jgi:molecular chaperone DnaJ
MAVKKTDYFLILGISRSESAEGVRAAFRKLAKRYHPDKSGSEGTRLFQEIAEAYRVLSDPDLRKNYSEQLQKAEERSRKHSAEKAAKKHSSVHRRSRSENISVHSIRGRGSWPGDSSLGFFRNFQRFGRSESSDTVELELILSPGEAREGGILPARIPIISPCPVCRGSDEIGFSVCPACRGRGVSKKTVDVRIKIPAGIGDGEVLEYQVNDLGRKLVFRMHVMITQLS